MKVADWMARWLVTKQITHVFGIIGAGNVSLFDAIARLGKTEIVPVHHEQAAAMCATYYWRTCGRLAAVLATTGAGSSNTLTGVLAAYMDSIPLLVISGNEPTKYIHRDRFNRVLGVQGYHSHRVVEEMTKMSVRAMGPEDAVTMLEESYTEALTPRFGPVWVDLPRDVQGMEVP